MINKKMIIVIAIFIATGFLVFSFAATPQGETIDNNGGSTNSNTNNDKNNTDNKNNTNSNIKDKDKDDKKDNDIVVTPIGSQDNQNNGQNNNLDNNGGNVGGGNQWAGGNTGGNNETPTPGENNGGNNGNNKPSEPSNPNEPSQPDEPNKPDEPSQPDINVDELTGPSVFVPVDEGIDATVKDNNVVIYEGVVEKSSVDDFGVYYVNVIVRAPYKYSQDVLKNASVVTPYGEKYNAGFLQYDSEGYAYFSIPQGFINGVSSELSLTVNWGVGENIVYTLKSNINVVD